MAMFGNGVCPVPWGSVPSPRMTLSPALCTQRSKPHPVSLSVSCVPSHVPCLCPVPIFSVLQGAGAMERTGVRWMVSPHCKLKPVRTAAVPVGHLSSSAPVSPLLYYVICLPHGDNVPCLCRPSSTSPQCDASRVATFDRFCPTEVVDSRGRSFL